MWRRSSRSGETGNCVEVRKDMAAVRDSKNPVPALPVPAAATRKLLTFLRARP